MDVGAPHRHSPLLEPAEQAGIGVPVPVSRTDAHQHRARSDRGEEAARRVAGAVVGQLEHVRAQVGSGCQQVGLCGELDVAGEQRGGRRHGGPQHEGAVVDRRAVVRIHTGSRMPGSEHVHGELRPPETLPGCQRHQRCARLRGPARDGPQRPVRLVDRADSDCSYRPPAHRSRQAADMVGMQVAEHDHGDALHAEPVEAGIDRAVTGAGVDQHHPARTAGGEHHGVALSDVARHHGPPGRRPSRRDEPRGHEHQPQPDEHREQHRSPPPRPAEHEQHRAPVRRAGGRL